MEPNPHDKPTPRYAAVVQVPNGNGGEKRLVLAALPSCPSYKESCTTRIRQNSPLCNDFF